jgi:DNA-binding CsgD family transcriptional regulator
MHTTVACLPEAMSSALAAAADQVVHLPFASTSITQMQAENSALVQDAVDAALPALTYRQREIIALMAQGLNTGEIADELSISRARIRTHVGRIAQKLSVNSQAEVAAWAVEHFKSPRDPRDDSAQMP